MKYIMLQHRQTKQKVPIIFPKYLSHINITDSILMDSMFGFNYTIISAGECTISCSSVHGKSESTGLTFGDGDSQVIDMMDYMHGLPE